MRRHIPAAALVLISLVAPTPSAQTTASPRATVDAAAYERARSLEARFSGKALSVPGPVRWLDDGSFWYRVSVEGGHTFVRVDPSSRAKTPAFDHERLASSLTSASGTAVTAVTLPFADLTFLDGLQAIRFTDDHDDEWRCGLDDYVCTELDAEDDRRRDEPETLPSPDGTHVALIRDHNVFVRAATDAEGGRAVTSRGTNEFPYTIGGLVWSPDSRKIASSRVVQHGDRRMVTYIDSTPDDQLQPKTFERFYLKPGDALDRQERALIDVRAARETPIDASLFPNPYNLTRSVWRDDSRAFTFEYNQRGHQVYRVIEVNAASAAARTLVEETSDTFIHYARATGELATGGRTFRHDVADGREIVWMSQRDGWSHLYLIDGATGATKHQITKGPWMVRGVDHVDEESRQIVFMAGGSVPGQDPYFVQYYRINFDGSGLTPLTTADAYHRVAFSPDRRYFVDTWSRIDLAPVSELRRASDNSLVMELERGDLAPLTAAGWRAPEAFVAKGRDSVTDVHGIIIRPTDFDPSKRYPVVESIYAGPHGSFVPKTFNEYYSMQALAELGFIVVQIDGMGTANRSKAFHDVAAKNLKDAGFPDRILWHKAVAAKYPQYDISRVGIFGGSAGGQNAMGGLLFHGDFYDAAVAFAGCHDNRMDKIWWNEQWMGWPIGPHYAESSNMENAWRLKGDLLLVVPELDTNVDPSSTMQVVDALIAANKEFDLLVMPGENHGGGRRGPSATYGNRKLWDFFVEHLLDAEPPDWNALIEATPPTPPSRVNGQGLWGQTWEAIAASIDPGR